MNEDRYIYKCPKCGSGDLRREVIEEYDSEWKDWVVLGTYNFYCIRCGKQGSDAGFRTTDY